MPDRWSMFLRTSKSRLSFDRTNPDQSQGLGRQNRHRSRFLIRHKRQTFGSSLYDKQQDLNAFLAAEAKKAVYETMPSKILKLQTIVTAFSSASSPFCPRHPANQTSLSIFALPTDVPTERANLPCRHDVEGDQGHLSREVDIRAAGRNGVGSSDVATPLLGSGISRTAHRAVGGQTADLCEAYAEVFGTDKVDPFLPTTLKDLRVAQHRSLSSELTGQGHDFEEADDKTLRTGLWSNPIHEEMTRVLTTEGDEAFQLCMSVKKWLLTVVPAVEEGNNTGVEIQDMAFGRLSSLQELGAKTSAFPASLHRDRASSVKLYLKSPGIEDYKRTLIEEDRTSMMRAQQLLTMLQGHYLEVVNIFQKNWQKLCEPKGHREEWS